MSRCPTLPHGAVIRISSSKGILLSFAQIKVLGNPVAARWTTMASMCTMLSTRPSSSMGCHVSVRSQGTRGSIDLAWSVCCVYFTQKGLQLGRVEFKGLSCECGMSIHKALESPITASWAVMASNLRAKDLPLGLSSSNGLSCEWCAHKVLEDPFMRILGWANMCVLYTCRNFQYGQAQGLWISHSVQTSMCKDCDADGGLTRYLKSTSDIGISS
jgi:hypothetical protein